jgi:N-acetylneuraminate lyase
MKFRLNGLVAATFTPMHDDGSLDLDRVAGLVEHIAAIGVGALFVGGSTGEGSCLTIDERKEALEAYVEASAGRLPLVAHVGHESLAEARGLTEHARSCGVDAIAAAPSAYFKAKTVEILCACLEEITSVAPELPFYYYHIPSLTGVALDMARLLELADERLPSFAGLKFSDLDYDMLRACTAYGDGKYEVVFGSDENLIHGLEAGCRGAIGSTYNFLAPAYLKILAAFDSGDLDEARRLQECVRAMVLAMLEYQSPLSSLKAVMGLVGQPCGPSRLPNVAMTAKETEELRERLAGTEFFEWVRP